MRKAAAIGVVLLVVMLLTAVNVRRAAAQTSASTRISNLTATESGGLVAINGLVQFRDAAGSFLPLTGVKVTFSWWQTSSSSATYIGEVYSSDSDGSFYYTWLDGLEPGQYYLNAAYAGGDSFPVNGTTYDFASSETNAQLLVPLELSINLDNPTLSVGQGDSATVTVKVTAENSNNAHPVSLSMTSSSELFATESFSPQSGSTPLVSKLSLNVLNVTQPGTYVITVIATSQQSNLPAVTVSTPLQILVQQNTHTITVDVQGLPLNVQTPLSVDGTFIEDIGPGTVTLTISNNATFVSVSQEIVSGDTRYSCQGYSQAASDQSVTSFTFNYSTEYRFTIKADLPQTIVSTLVLNVNGTDYGQDNFRPALGFSDFYPQNSIVNFAITPSYITTDVVNYNLSAWKDLTTGNLMSPTNASSDGFYQITLTRPYHVEAYYDEFADVTIKTNLPSDMSTQLQIGMAGSANKTVNVVGSVAYPVGQFLVGSTFECDISQDQLVLYNSAGNTRYEFQGMTPLIPITLEKHTTVELNYSIEYRVQVASTFPSAILQPVGGSGWYAPGDMATVQVQNVAPDGYGFPYVFEGWSGALSSNETRVSFRVTSPVDLYAQWGPNWIQILAIGVVAVGLTVASALVVKRKIRGWRSAKKAVPKKRAVMKKQGDGEGDLKLYNYIIDRGGSIKFSEAMNDLAMTREEINRSIGRLKESHMLREG